MIKEAMDVLEGRSKHVVITNTIHNVDRTFGATLSHEISKRKVEEGLPDNSIGENTKYFHNVVHLCILTGSRASRSCPTPHFFIDFFDSLIQFYLLFKR